MVSEPGLKPTKLLIATANPGKMREYRQLLAGLPLLATSLREEGLAAQVPEEGATYEENATAKARTYAQASGLLTLAEDSGLEVEALGSRPGVRSARYGGVELSDGQRVELLLRQLAGVPWEKRRARFVCVVSLAQPKGLVHTFRGICQGVIALAPRGVSGFGYDPVFYVPELDRTMAELSLKEKNRVSHRGRAVETARAFLMEILSPTP